MYTIIDFAVFFITFDIIYSSVKQQINEKLKSILYSIVSSFLRDMNTVTLLKDDMNGRLQIYIRYISVLPY